LLLNDLVQRKIERPLDDRVGVRQRNHLGLIQVVVTLDADVFIKISPVNSFTTTDQSPVGLNGYGFSCGRFRLASRIHVAITSASRILLVV